MPASPPRTMPDGWSPSMRRRPKACAAPPSPSTNSIEHGYGGTDDVFRLMKQKNVGGVATLAASEAYARYFQKWNGQEPAPESVRESRRSFQAARRIGVPICMGGDVGVFRPRRELAGNGRDAPGRNARSGRASSAAGSGNARIFKLSDRGSVRPGPPRRSGRGRRRSYPGSLRGPQGATGHQGWKGRRAGHRTMTGKKPMHPDTKLVVKDGRHKDWLRGMVNVPVSRTSTVLFDTIEEMDAAYPPKDGRLSYGRRGTPTQWSLAEALTELSRARKARCSIRPGGRRWRRRC